MVCLRHQYDMGAMAIAAGGLYHRGVQLGEFRGLLGKIWAVISISAGMAMNDGAEQEVWAAQALTSSLRGLALYNSILTAIAAPAVSPGRDARLLILLQSSQRCGSQIVWSS